MNTNQRDFLNELGMLFEKYHIEVVTFTKGACFESNGEILVFDEYQNGEFTDVRVRTGNYKPVTNKNDNPVVVGLYERRFNKIV